MLKDLLDRAWQTRLRNFDSSIGFARPVDTKSVSLTGKNCGLKCAHCGGHYLQSMLSLEEAKMQAEEGKAKSLLVSGGCGPTGKVPFVEYAKDLEVLSRNLNLNFHVGLVNEEEAALVGKLARAVSFDFVGDNETIEEVYGLKNSVDDYVRSYEYLKRHSRVIPHICIGLRGGRISGEYEALRLLSRLGADALTFIVLIPTRGTEFANVSPPPVPDVVRVLAEARVQFPETPVMLGCMRPAGAYRRAVDILAVRAGVNSIVNPSRAAQSLARRLGLTPVMRRECCSLD